MVTMGAERGQVVGLFGAEPFVCPVMGVQRRLGGRDIAEPAAEARGAERFEPGRACTPGVARDVLSVLHQTSFVAARRPLTRAGCTLVQIDAHEHCVNSARVRWCTITVAKLYDRTHYG